jgi:hypothetical protein
MNEKINGLWDKAVTLVEQEPDGDWSLDTIKEKFAELIVKECVDKIAHNEKFNWLDAAQAAKDLKEHFGVTK